MLSNYGGSLASVLIAVFPEMHINPIEFAKAPGKH